jgi:hypothetical protein
MSSGRYINETRRINYQKPLPIEEYKKIESSEKHDQSYAIMRYRDLVKVRKEREKLRPRDPEVYHHDICKK